MRELPSSSRQGREPSTTTPRWPVLPEQGRNEPIATQSRLELSRQLPIQENPGPIQVTPSDVGPSEQPRGGTTPRGRPRRPEPRSGQPEPRSGPPEPRSGPPEPCCLLYLRCLRLCCILLASAESEYNSGPPGAHIVEIQTSPTPSVVPDVATSDTSSSQQPTEHPTTSSSSPNVSSACDRGHQPIGSIHESGEVHDRPSESSAESARSNPHTPLSPRLSRSTLQYYQPTEDQRVSSSSNSTALAVVPPALSSAHTNSQSVQSESSHHPLPTSERQPSVSTPRSTQPRHHSPMSTRTQSPNMGSTSSRSILDYFRNCYNGCRDCCSDCYDGCRDCCRDCYNGCCDCCRDCYNGCKECCNCRD